MIKSFIKAIHNLDSVTLGESLSDSVFLRDKDESITRDKSITIEKLLSYSNQPFEEAMKYESFFVVNMGGHLMMKIKVNGKYIEKIYIKTIDSKLRRMRIDFAYDGSKYFGFQKQANHLNPSIQKTVEKVLSHITQEPSKIIASGRTDKGVHALDQTAHFDTYTTLDSRKMHYLLDKMLPSDIKIKALNDVPAVFHARYDCLKKTYLYKITHKKDPFNAHYAYYIKSIDIDALKKVLMPLKGQHDFVGFSKKASGLPTIRTIDEIQVVSTNGETHILIKASGFLRHMVRIIVGNAIKDVVNDKKAMHDALNHPSKDNIKYMAPPVGLYLHTLEY